MDFDEYDKPQYPLVGLPVSDVAEALAVLPEGSQILRFDTRRDGWLLVETGRLVAPRAGAGQRFLLQRTESGWIVSKTTSWRA